MRRHFKLISLILTLFPVYLKAEIQVIDSDERGVRFIYRPGEPVTSGDRGGTLLEFPDAEPVAFFRRLRPAGKGCPHRCATEWWYKG